MKFSAAQLKTLSHSGVGKFSSALFYGEEESFIQEKITTFIKDILKISSSEITVIEAEKILSKEVFLEDLLGVRMLWGDDSKAIWVKNASDKLLSLLTGFLEDSTSTGFLLITTDKYLKPASKMRQYYEEKSNTLSVGCFAPTPDDIRKKLVYLFHVYKKDIHPDVLHLLSEAFVSNTMVLESEVQKIINYVGGKSFIDRQDVENCLSIEEVLDYDSLTHAFLSGTPGEMIHFFKQQVAEGGASIGLIRSLLIQVRRLYALKCLMSEGKAFDQAAFMVTPQIFSQAKEKIKGYLDLWSPEALETLLTLLMQGEKDCKTLSDLGDMVTERAFIRGMQIRKRKTS